MGLCKNLYILLLLQGVVINGKRTFFLMNSLEDCYSPLYEVLSITNIVTSRMLCEVSRLRTHYYMPLQLCKTQYSLYFEKLFKFKTSTIGMSAFSIFSNPVSET